MRASLDGWSAEANLVVEIKCPGAKDHAVAQAGMIPAKYYPQLQHLLAVSGADACHYVSYRDDDIVVLGVKPKAEYIAKLVREEEEFWDCVKTGRPPRPMVV
jgi:predicted phage-related endonuclease